MGGGGAETDNQGKKRGVNGVDSMISWGKNRVLERRHSPIALGPYELSFRDPEISGKAEKVKPANNPTPAPVTSRQEDHLSQNGYKTVTTLYLCLAETLWVQGIGLSRAENSKSEQLAPGSAVSRRRRGSGQFCPCCPMCASLGPSGSDSG